MPDVAFDFGENWQAFSDSRMDAGRFQAAVASLRDLLGNGHLQGKTFLDIGCGSGIFSLAAVADGAGRVVGMDINPKSIEASNTNAIRLKNQYPLSGDTRFLIGSALDPDFMESLGTFDVVYAWGSLHHTGHMWDAIRLAAARTAEGGTFVVAIYNKHWSCRAWRLIKYMYNVSPQWLQKVWAFLFSIMLFSKELLATRRNPFKKERGMDYWYDVKDWLGGYPYEYAAPSDVVAFLQTLGFSIRKTVATNGYTGCNQFVFRRTSQSLGSQPEADVREEP